MARCSSSSRRVSERTDRSGGAAAGRCKIEYRPSNRHSGVGSTDPRRGSHDCSRHRRLVVNVQAARRRLPGHFPAARRDRHPVAGPRSGGGRTSYHGADRDRDERLGEPRGDEVGLAVRPLERSSDVWGRHRQLLRPPAGIREAPRPFAPAGCDPGSFTALLAVWTGLSLCRRESGSVSDGREDHPGLGPREAIQVGPGRRGHVFARRPHHAVSGRARSDAAGRGGTLRSCGRRGVGREQRERRRRILLRGWAILLRARAWPSGNSRRHRQGRAGCPQRNSSAGQGCRRRRNRECAASRAIRIQRQ